MLKTSIACLLVWTVMLLALPTRSTAQTRAEPAGALAVRETLTRKSDLKLTFAAEVERIRADTNKVNAERIRQASQNPKPPSSFSKKDKIFLALFIVVMTGLVVVLIKHPCRPKKPGDCEFIDDTTSF
ncbi:MAG: hypothetical protein JWM21_2600 [Acidobacteria bacterium]|nr:hypothetical protein [Acidobacteriota bacterium]